MAAHRPLHDLFVQAAQKYPDRTAVIEPHGDCISYAELDRLSDRLRNRLWALGVRPGDRVGIYMRKSIDAVATIYGILKVGAAYVPVDPSAPVSRNAYILQNCTVKVIVAERSFAIALRAEWQSSNALPNIIQIEAAGGGAALHRALVNADSVVAAPPCETKRSEPDDLAYILYTSGSTGKPKGVMLSHENAVSFVDWCSETFCPTEADRFSSHAPFHFDLSILDIHLSLKHGSTLILVGEDIGKDAVRLAQLIADQRITCWYSAPSILSLLAQFGNLQNHDYSSLRLVLFAGEVFPVKHLRALTSQLPKPRYFNLYGPTETNVCNFLEVSLPVPEDRTNPYPIGKVCSHLRGRIVDKHGQDVAAGSEGELCIIGRGVMQGYWGLADQTERSFLFDFGGSRWYRTGDIVAADADGICTYIGRRDSMIKRRGYRIELGEVESGLYSHPLVKEVAVIAVADEEAGVRIKAFLSCRAQRHPSLIEMKRHCAEKLPLYMVPDQFVWCESLPRTSTNKVDYQRLKEID